MRRERGCIEDGIVPFIVDGERVYRCPLKLATDMTYRYIEAYGFYKKSLLPNGVIYLNETQKYIEAMSVLDSECARMEREQMEQASKRKR